MQRLLARHSRRLRNAAAVFVCVALSTVASGSAGWGHPLHTTFTEVTLDPADGTMRLTIRTFADDFSAAAARHAGKAPPADHRVPDAMIVAYIAARMSVTDPNGRRAPMTWGGTRQVENLLWITVRVPSVRSLRGMKLGCALLFEMFDDQVNIVQATYGRQRHSMLFTTSDGGKLRTLP